ncbi:MAG: helix-turn-helix domain-containing protein [Streptosporangiales bacterium]|nr:helix-turn-helix domain-containing protein [Streptosporangiales bacterium]
MGEVIRQRRANLGLSQAALAEAAGVDTRQIRRYEAGDQQPLLSVAIAIADALGISVSELAGRPANRVTITGDWWASWQTYRDGVEKVATQPIHMRQEGDLVHIAATRRGLGPSEGGYLWTGELKFWDNEVLTGWYAANDGSIRSKGTMYLVMHPHGIHMSGRWVGLGYDDKIMTGWASMGKTSEDSEATMTDLIARNGARTDE